MQFREINDVEIFQAGDYPQGAFDEKAIQDLVDTFESVGNEIKPYLKLGHDNTQKLVQKDGLPALGWIAKLRKKGDKLIADIKGMPEKIYELIMKGAYRRISSEIYPEIKLGDKIYKNVLKAVALLGGDTPQVKSLDDIIALGYADGDVTIEIDKSIKYDANLFIQGDTMTEKALEVLEAQVKEFKEKVEALSAKEKEFTEVIKSKDEEIKKLKADNEKQFAEIEKVRIEKEDVEIAQKVEKFIEDKKILPSQKDNVIKMIKSAKSDEGKKNLQEFIDAQTISLHTEQSTNGGKPNSETSDDPEGDKLDKEVKKYMEEHQGVTYGVAYRKIRSEQKIASQK